uniref:DUF4005 domain-containing protein n=1 Tax=Setaria digitata TaxID=48799 RepID=A0A915Q824_9BILA
MYPVSSVPLALLFPNVSLSAPTTPTASETTRNNNHQAAEHFHHHSNAHIRLLHSQGDNSEQNSKLKYRLKSEPLGSRATVDKSTARKSKHASRAASSTSVGVSVPWPAVATQSFSSSAPAATDIFRSRLPSKDTSPVKSALQKQPFSLDSTPKRKLGKARHARRQQQQDNVNFAGAKFSESPEAKVVPLPPFIWCEEASSSSSCSGDEQHGTSVREVMKVDKVWQEQLQQTPKWNKCIPNLQMTPLHFVAVLPSS